MKHILIIETGGTIMMDDHKGDGTFTPNEKNIEDYIPDLKKIAKISFLPLCQKDSANFQISDWQNIAQNIEKIYTKYDGFVIIHGTDTMAYTSSALSLIFQNLDKPVILTGSQVPLSEPASDGYNNVINSVKFACLDIAEVCICFGSRLIRGNKATKISEFHLGAFETVNAPYLGKIGLDIMLKNYHKKPEGRILKVQSEFDKNVAHIKLFPNLNLDLYTSFLTQQVTGIVIEGFGAGNIPHYDKSYDSFLQTAVAQGIIVVISTQCIYGTAEYERYIGGNEAKKLGCLTSFDMSKEMAIIKLMWVLANSNSIEEAKSLYTTNLVQEINHKYLY